MKACILILVLLSQVTFAADKKISGLTTFPAASWVTGDLVPIVDVSGSGTTKSTTIGDFDTRYVVSPLTTNGDQLFRASGVPARLAIGSANTVQISNGTAPAFSLLVNANVDPAAAIVDTKLATISTASKVANSATTATSANTASAIVARDGSGNFTAGVVTAALTGNVTGNLTGNVTGNVTGAVTGNASTATALAADPSDCSANTYATTIAASGNLTCASITNASTTASASAGNSTIVLRDGSGNFAAGTITASLTGLASLNTSYTANQYGVVLSGAANTMSVLAPDASTSKVLKSGGASANPTWLAYDNANTASTLVARDGSGNFTAGTVTAALTGTASGNTTYSANNHGVVLSSGTNAMVVVAPVASTAKVLTSGGSSADPAWTMEGLSTPTTGSTFGNNTASGSLTAARVTAIGVSAGVADTSGADNTFVGNSAGSLVTTGGSNTVFGSQSGTTTITTGARNTLIGALITPGNLAATDQVMIGNGVGAAASSSNGDVAIGSLAQGNNSNQTANTTLATVSIGYSANGNASYAANASVTIGAFSSSGGADDVVLGSGIQSNHADTFVVGHGGNTVSTNYVATSAANQISFGSSTKALKDMYIGSGALGVAAPANASIQPTPVLAGTSNTAGATMTLTGGNSTGTGAGGTILFKTAPAGSTGSTVNTETTVGQVDSTGAWLLGAASTSPAHVVNGSMGMNGSSSGTVSIKTQAAAGTYNFNLPITVGTTGYFLTSAGGGSSAMTWTAPAAGAVFVAPTIQNFLSTGSTTGYMFTITSGNATVGATFTNNGNTYTVLATVASATQVFMSQASAPQASGTLTRASGSGDATLTFSAATALGTYTTPANVLYVRVRMIGGGGGGSGSGTSGGNTGLTAGGPTFFGAGMLNATGGGTGGTGSGGTGGTGGTGALGTVSTGNTFTGSRGGGVTENVVSGGVAPSGGMGGDSPFGGNGGGGANSSAGTSATANSGSGGGGGGTSSVAANFAGGGGGSGGYIDATIVPTAAQTFVYAIGAAGVHGNAGTNGQAGGDGGSGRIIVDEYYQ